LQLGTAEASLKATHAAAGVEDLLLARVERMALCAHVSGDVTGLDGGTRHEVVAARAHDLGRHIFGMDTLLHSFLLGYEKTGSPAPVADVNRNLLHYTRLVGFGQGAQDMGVQRARRR